MSDLKISSVIGRGIPLSGNDLDTDRVIPARFMKCVTFDDLGQYLFYDARFNEDGSQKNHPLNEEKYKGGNILVVRRNFGCGSSREHAPQSIARYGIQALVGESFAEIFADNCTSIGLVAVTASEKDIDALSSAIEKNPQIEIQLDLVSQTLTCGDLKISIMQSKQAQQSLVSGTWDTTAELLAGADEVKAVIARLPYANK